MRSTGILGIPLQPEYARNSLLWLVEEVGEVVAIFKKRGERETAQNPQLREAFLTEMSDVLMYFTDVLLRMGVSSEEFAAAYGKKHARNMGRDYSGEYERFLP